MPSICNRRRNRRLRNSGNSGSGRWRRQHRRGAFPPFAQFALPACVTCGVQSARPVDFPQFALPVRVHQRGCQRGRAPPSRVGWTFRSLRCSLRARSSRDLRYPFAGPKRGCRRGRPPAVVTWGTSRGLRYSLAHGRGLPPALTTWTCSVVQFLCVPYIGPPRAASNSYPPRASYEVLSAPIRAARRSHSCSTSCFSAAVSR